MDDFTTKNNELEALDKEFQELLQHLSGDENLEKYRAEYEKLYKAFRISFENEKRLVKQCRELNEMIVNNAASVKAALEMSQEDSNTIKRLRKEIEKAWQFVEKAKDKEERSKKMVQDLKGEISHLNEIVEQGAALSLGPENNVHELIKTKDELNKQNEEKMQKISLLEGEKNDIEGEKAQDENKVLTFTEGLKRQKELCEKLEVENKHKDGKIKAQADQHKSIKGELENKDQEKLAVDTELTVRIKERDTLVKKEQELDNKLSDLYQENKIISDSYNKNVSDKMKRLDEYRDKKRGLEEAEKKIEEMNNTKEEIKEYIEKIEEEENSLVSALNELQQNAAQLEDEKKLATSTIQVLERELEQLQKKLDEDKQLYQSLRVDNNAIRKKVKDAETKNVDTEERLKSKANEITNWKNELDKKRKDYTELQKQKEKIEAEKALLFARVAKAKSKVQQLQEDCKLKDNLHAEIERKMNEYREKAKEKEQLYEVVRSDRNLYSKNLIEAQEEVEELKRKFDITTQQINQLKEELEAKDRAVVERKHALEIEKQKKTINEQKVLSQKAEMELLKNSEKEKEVMITNLASMLRAGENMIKSLQKSYDDAIREKDVFGTELIRRNDELTILCEKIKILQSTLAKGDVQYKEKEIEIKMHMETISEQKALLEELEKKAGMVEQLRREIHNLNNSLIQEKMQVQALSEELENPINVHRWRKLEGTDPDTYEMLQKIHALQKRLIKKTEEVISKDGALQDKEKKIQHLKLTLARQPGPETADAIEVYRQNLGEKTKQMKAMSAELDMYQAQVNSYKATLGQRIQIRDRAIEY